MQGLAGVDAVADMGYLMTKERQKVSITSCWFATTPHSCSIATTSTTMHASVIDQQEILASTASCSLAYKQLHQHCLLTATAAHRAREHCCWHSGCRSITAATITTVRVGQQMGSNHRAVDKHRKQQVAPRRM
jgi:hypothetical protein